MSEYCASGRQLTGTVAREMFITLVTSMPQSARAPDFQLHAAGALPYDPRPFDSSTQCTYSGNVLGQTHLGKCAWANVLGQTHLAARAPGILQGN